MTNEIVEYTGDSKSLKLWNEIQQSHQKLQTKSRLPTMFGPGPWLKTTIEEFVERLMSVREHGVNRFVVGTQLLTVNQEQGWKSVYMNKFFKVKVSKKFKSEWGVFHRAQVTCATLKQIEGHWETLFAIKNEIFGEEAQAFEIHPPLSQLSTGGETFYLWVSENKIPMGLYKNLEEIEYIE